MNWFNHYKFGGILLGGKVSRLMIFDANLSVSKDSMRLSQDRTEGPTMKLVDFDSSQYAKRLREAGLAQPIADIEAEAMGEMGRYLAALSAEAEKRDVMAEAARKETDAKIDTATAGLNARIDTATAELNAKIDTAAAGLNSKIDRVSIELNAKIDKVALELNAKIDEVATALNAKIDRVAIELNARIVCLGAELRAQMSANQGALIRWVVTVGILQSALITALVLKLVH